MNLRYFKLSGNLLEKDLFKKTVAISFILHLSILLFFSIKALVFPSEALNLDAAIRIDMVDLPDKIANLPEPQQPQQPEQPQKTKLSEPKSMPETAQLV